MKKKLFKIVINLDAIFHKIDTRLHRKAKGFFGYAKSEEISPRVFEYSFLIRNMPERGTVLDVGCTAGLNFLPVALSDLGYEVYGIDLRPFKIRSNNFQFIMADARYLPFRNVFDFCYGVSTVEHIGLRGTSSPLLGKIEDLEGDIKAIKEIQSTMKPNGIMIITIPFGKSDILPRIASRIYDANGIERLFNGLTIVAEEYVTKIGDTWQKVSQNEAAKANHASEDIAVAMFKLHKQKEKNKR
ncbi:MAG: class I SAM-dependent methyltransferase [Candidatus Aminicenantes bacterium]|nr:class I SAM-dependent methyltransferase [Candidatus Aminicenantes bacterium]